MAMVILHCHAQNNKKEQDEFESFRSNIHKDFESFRAEIMRNYIEFIKNPWKEFESVAPVPKPQKIPVPPVVLPKIDTIHINSNPITIEDIIPPIPVTPQPQPIEEIPENDTVKEKSSLSIFMGHHYRLGSLLMATIRLEKSQKRKLEELYLFCLLTNIIMSFSIASKSGKNINSAIGHICNLCRAYLIMHLVNHPMSLH